MYLVILSSTNNHSLADFSWTAYLISELFDMLLYVENTAFSVTYQSKNLKNTEEKDNKGTLNFKVKISL